MQIHHFLDISIIIKLLEKLFFFNIEFPNKEHDLTSPHLSSVFDVSYFRIDHKCTLSLNGLNSFIYYLKAFL